MTISPSVKKISLILALAIAVILIIFGIVYFLRQTPIGQQIFGTGKTSTTTVKFPIPDTRTSTQNGQITTNPQQLPIGINGNNTNPNYYQPKPVTQITTDQALYSSLNSNGAIRYHNISDGKFYEIMPDGKIKQMADQVFYNVTDVTWAKNQDKAVLKLVDDSKIVYDFQTKKQVTLPSHWDDFSFSSDGNQIAAKSMGLSPENRWLITTNDDGTGTKLVENLGEFGDRVTVDWSPSRQTVAFSQTGEPLGADRREVLLLGTNGENLKSIVVEGLNFSPNWSPSGKKLLYSVDSARSDFKPELWITNAYGDDINSNRQSLKINTWANKCSFGDDDVLFCAVPRDLPEGSGITPEIAANYPDDLYKIDLKTNTKSPVTLGEDYRIQNISYDKVHNKVFFTDSSRNGVFEVKL
jgi:dipeptidyl aminopeptidase/acylaminoacyl peptidase